MTILRRRMTALLLTLACMLTLCAPAFAADSLQAENPFTDVPADAYYYKPVVEMTAAGLFSGVTETTFCPNMDMSRGMLVAVLYRMEGSPEADPETKYTDVSPTQYYAKAVAWADENRIVYGNTDGTFRPNAAITREQYAAILYRYAQYRGFQTPLGSISGFTDARDVQNYALFPIRWAVGAGIIRGMTETTLNPKGNTTRAQGASMLYRFITYYKLAI